MKKIIKYRYAAALVVMLLTLASCNKYLDINPRGTQVLTTTKDYDQWLNSTEVETCEPSDLNDFGDNRDYLLGNFTLPPLPGAPRAYLWYDQFDPNISSTPLIWNQHYATIYYFNTVIQHVDKAIGDTQKKASLKAEALIGRALEYLYLVNEYGKQYNPQTAATDLAVPFVESNDLTTPVPQRSTVQQIYDHILADINAAIPNLPADNSTNRFRGDVAAAYSLLARTYLLMGNYTLAGTNAQAAITNATTNAMIDLNQGITAVNFPFVLTRKDAIYARTYTGSNVINPQQSFLQSMDPNDIRLTMWYFNYTGKPVTAARLSYLRDNGNVINNWGTSVQEMRLILAEVAARNNKLDEAAFQLDIVRRCRIKSANYTIYTTNDQAAMFQAVIKERSFEMPFNGTRWFDMRRLNAEGKMPTVYRIDPTQLTTNAIATLAPNSPRYTLQIPIQIMYYHPDWKQNP
ncbi:MAG: RagB/SusD family nutrient uptake outer membrane protein [Mucilaginibacter sp.]|nr:RagB/SusD family nutrient uptake outer membrane protein [Mucilaginibacter sp.]